MRTVQRIHCAPSMSLYWIQHATRKLTRQLEDWEYWQRYVLVVPKTATKNISGISWLLFVSKQLSTREKGIVKKGKTDEAARNSPVKNKHLWSTLDSKRLCFDGVLTFNATKGAGNGGEGLPTCSDSSHLKIEGAVFHRSSNLSQANILYPEWRQWQV